jgi:heme oxygenase
MEKRLDVKARFARPDDYLAHMRKMWGFCAPLEAGIDPGALRDALPDYESRRKLPLLTRDLLALGTPAADVSHLARCMTLPACAEPAAVFGCLYVLEGASLGGRTLLPLVERNLGFTESNGAAFLASYGARVDAMWQTFGMALEGWCSTPARSDLATAAAASTFDALDGWLCG